MILSELFTDKYQYHPIEKKGNQLQTYFDDATGEEVIVKLAHLKKARKSNAYAIGFLRKGEGTFLTNDGKEVSKLLGTVVAAVGDMIKYVDRLDKELNEFIHMDLPRIEVIALTAETESNRARLYDRMVDRMASKYGFTKDVKPEVRSEIESLPGAAGAKVICMARKGSDAAA